MSRPKKLIDGKRITIRIAGKDYARLQKIANKKTLDVSDVVRESIKNFLIFK